MPFQSTTSSAKQTTREPVRANRATGKWPLWKTYSFILVFCSIAWAAIIMLLFNLAG